MGFGECLKENFIVLGGAEPPQQPINSVSDRNSGCCYALPVFHDTSSDDLKNDRSDYFCFFGDNCKGAKLYLQGWDGSAYTDIIQLFNNNIGVFYDFGFIHNQYGQKAIGILVDWKKVYQSYGNGDYRFKVESEYIFGENQVGYSFEYCLSNYRDYLADNTVRFDTKFEGVYESNNRYERIDFDGFAWVGQIRIPQAFIGKPKSQYDKEYISYQSGEKVWIKDEQVESYLLDITNAPAYLHEYFKKYVLQSDQMLVTDYNLTNPYGFIKKPMIFNSSYEPSWDGDWGFASVQVELVEAFNFKQKKRC